MKILPTVSLLIAATSMHAATLGWNPNQDAGTNLGGDGSWLASGNWYNGSSNVAWVNGSPSVFGGTGGVVTLSDNVQVASMSFETDGYSILSNTSGANRVLIFSGTNTLSVQSGVVNIGSASLPVGITLGSLSVDVAAGAELVQTGVDALGNMGSGSITKIGEGTFTIVGPKTYVGGTNLRAGTISISDFQSLGGSTSPLASISINIRNQATLQITATTTTPDNQHYRFDANSGGIIDVTGANVATLNNALLAPASNVDFKKTGTGTLVLNGGVTGLGTETILEGVLEMNGTTLLASVIASGGTLAGTGNVADVTLNNGGVFAPGSSGDALEGSTLLWNPGGELAYELGAGTLTGFLDLSGSLTRGSSGSGSGFLFNFSDAGGFLPLGQTYDLMSFTSTDFSVSDFGFTSSISGLNGEFYIAGGNLLQFTILAIPEPSSAVLLGLGIAGLWIRGRRVTKVRRD